MSPVSGALTERLDAAMSAIPRSPWKKIRLGLYESNRRGVSRPNAHPRPWMRACLPAHLHANIQQRNGMAGGIIIKANRTLGTAKDTMTSVISKVYCVHLKDYHCFYSIQ